MAVRQMGMFLHMLSNIQNTFMFNCSDHRQPLLFATKWFYICLEIIIFQDVCFLSVTIGVVP